MPFGVGFPELIVLLVVLLLVFGAKRLPEMGRSLGKGMREFKDGVSGVEDSVTEPSPPAELPTVRTTPVYNDAAHQSTRDAAEVQRDLESLSEEDRKAIVESLSTSERPAAPESERETVS